MAKLKSMSLEFSYRFDDAGLWGIINYETEAPEKNLLMRVQMGYYSLDIADFQAEHKEIYDEISMLMRKYSADYWLKVNGNL